MFANLLGPYDYDSEVPAQVSASPIDTAQTDHDFKRIEARHAQWATIFGAITAIATIFALTRRGK